MEGKEEKKRGGRGGVGDVRVRVRVLLGGERYVRKKKEENKMK